MAVTSRARGTVAALGLFLLFAGLVGGGVLYIVAQRRPGQTVDGFARAPVGCTTTLEFTETGTFFVFEEVGAVVSAVSNGCQPVADPTAPFGVEFTGELTPTAITDDTSVSYDVDGFDGRSVQSVEITEPGQYDVEVKGDDLTVVAALGRDPSDGVDSLRRTGLWVAIVGIVLGLALLIVSGRRTKKAWLSTAPDGPGWGPAQRPSASGWTPEPPRPGQVPVNPHQPLEPASVTSPPRNDPSTWQPPSGEADPDAGEPDPSAPPPPPPPPPPIEPVLPDAPGRTSGT